MTVILSSGLGRNRQDTSLEIGWLHLLPPSITPLSPACPPILISCFFISFLALLLIPLKWARVCFTICLLHRPSPPMRLQVWRNQSYLPLSSTVALQAVFHYFSTALYVWQVAIYFLCTPSSPSQVTFHSVISHSPFSTTTTFTNGFLSSKKTLAINRFLSLHHIHFWVSFISLSLFYFQRPQLKPSLPHLIHRPQEPPVVFGVCVGGGSTDDNDEQMFG